MILAPTLKDEKARLASLQEYGVHGTLLDPGFDRLIHLAVNIFRVPIALITLVEAHRQLFAASFGVSICETSRDISFCGHALGSDEIMVVLDALDDPRFADNPLVIGEPKIRFYAGMPLRSPSGHAIGTLCLIDQTPHSTFDLADRTNLTDLAALVMDKLEMRRLERARDTSQSRFENIAATSPDAIICADHLGNISFWNASAERMLGYTSNQILGKPIGLVAPDALVDRLAQLSATIHVVIAQHSIETEAIRADGEVVSVELSASMWPDNGHSGFGAIIRDITERRQNEARLFDLAHMDPLTGLPNRTLLISNLELILKNEQAACVMIIDLDGFKDVNDSLGHPAGDSLLISVALRLSSAVRTIDTVARMGGDEFALLLPGYHAPLQAGAIADEIIATVSEIITIEGQPVNIGASVGVALYPEHGTSVQALLSSADLALYQAKAEGRHCRRFFTESLREVALARRAYQAEVRRAYEREEFELYYQPQVRLSDRAIVGAEALLRWNHPDKGLLTPAAFLSALEMGPWAERVGEWVIRTACHQAATWRRTGKEFRMGVNVSGAQFRSGDLAQKIFAALTDAELPPHSLEIELTENIILRQDEATLRSLGELRQAGVGIAFDDYGTGYASLSMLKRYPVTRLKIDQSFVRAMCESPSDAAIVRAVLYLGKSFGLAVIAEGVETLDQCERLRKKGCLEAQGYLFGKPVPAAEFGRCFGFLN